MHETEIHINYSDLNALLLPRLRGRVFHITTQSAYASTISDSAIKPNRDGQYCFTFGQSENSFFRNRGCVSVFDLRAITPEQEQKTLYKYNFLNPSFAKGHPIFLFLNKSCHAQLLPWTLWKEQNALREMVIPYAEAGFQGEIPLALVDEVLRVNIAGRFPETKKVLR